MMRGALLNTGATTEIFAFTCSSTQDILIEHLHMPGHGTGPRNVRENKMNSEMEDTPQRSGREDCKHKKDCTAAKFSSF